MGTVIKSQKTELFYAATATTVAKIVAVTSFTGLGGARDQIETTDLDNATDKSYTSGLGSPSPVTLNINLQKGELSHKALLDMKASGVESSWGIYSSDAATAPTALASVLQKVTGRVSAIFQGYVSDVNLDVSGNNIWKGTITLQRTGPVSWDVVPA